MNEQTGYFECNLPDKAPPWLHHRLAGQFETTVKNVKNRMRKLDEALTLLPDLDGGTFSKHAKVLFDHREEGNPGSFDRCSAKEIAAFVSMLDDGSRAEPRLEWPNATVVVDTAFVSRKEWELLRHIGIGGSDASVILGTSLYQNESSLYHRKVGTPFQLPEKRDSTWVFERGHFLEEKVIEAFCKTTGATIVPETRMFASKTHPNCTANIDAILRFSDGRIFIFEAKTTVAENWLAWAYDKIPPHYVLQTRQYPAVLDDSRICGTYIACLMVGDKVINGCFVGADYNPDELVCRFVPRDALSETAQLEAEEKWFRQYVMKGQEPPRNGKASNPAHPEAGELEVLRRLVGHADESKPAQWWELLDYETTIFQWLSAKEEQSVYQAKADAAKEVADYLSIPLIEKLGTAIEADVDAGDGQSYYEVKYAPRTKTKVNGEALNLLIPTIEPLIPPEMAERLKACIEKKEDAFRVFSIKQKKYKRLKGA